MIAPKCSVKSLSSAEVKKAVMCLAVKTGVFNKVCSVFSYSAVGREFQVQRQIRYTE